MADEKAGCARSTGARIGELKPEKDLPEKQVEEAKQMNEVRVGVKAPDFVAPAYFQGGFTTVKLSGYLGKWVLLCFYPGDFTFV